MTSEGFGNWHETEDDDGLPLDLDDAPTIYAGELPARWPPRSGSWDHPQSGADWDSSVPVVW